MDEFDLRLWDGFVEAGGNPHLPAIVDEVSIDSRRISSKNVLFIPLPGKNVDGHAFVPTLNCLYAIVKKDWQTDFKKEGLTLLRVEDPLFALQEIAKTYRNQLKTKVIAINGSFGKTMVKDLLQQMIGKEKSVSASPESFNSQIGVPLSLLSISKQDEIALIEASISHPHEMERLQEIINPTSVVMTHIGKKHLATLKSLENIASELMLLTYSAKEWVLLPNSTFLDPHIKKIKTLYSYWNSLDYPFVEIRKKGPSLQYKVNFSQNDFFEGEVKSGFAYFLDLLNITIKAATLLGISPKSIKKALSEYILEPTRTEIFRTINGATVINDCYSSDPQSIDKALKLLNKNSLEEKHFAFCGLKGNNTPSHLSRIGKAIVESRIDHLYLIGSHPFDELIYQLDSKVNFTQFESEKTAFDHLKKLIRSKDTLLIKGEKKHPLDIVTEAFNESITTNQCFINLAAIEDNISQIRHKLPFNTRIMVMVKALAYGTNDVRISQFLSDCGIDILGVSYVDEGVLLRQSSVKQAIFVLNALHYEASKIASFDLEVGVSEKGLILALAEEAKRQNKKIKVHLHVNTGMSRLGCRCDEAVELAKYITSFPQLILEGVMTHFASADDKESDAFTLQQIHSFETVVAELKNVGFEIPYIHAANSSGVLRFSLPQFNMVRLGLAIYGLYPSEACKTLDLRLAISLQSKVVGINYCKEGESISYGRSYIVTKNEQTIAVLPIGYFDGLHRNYSDKGYVMIQGLKAPIVGKICMDYMMVDITDIPNVKIGDSVLIFGEDEYGHYLSPEELALSGNSIIYELMTCLGPRIQRIFIHEEALTYR